MSCRSRKLWQLVIHKAKSHICPRRPETREVTRRQPAVLLHRNLTSPPSLWPGRELRKYHYPCAGSSLCWLQSNITGLTLIAVPFQEVTACSPGSSLHGNVSGEWYSVFKIHSQNIRSVCHYSKGNGFCFLGTNLSHLWKRLFTFRAYLQKRITVMWFASVLFEELHAPILLPTISSL